MKISISNLSEGVHAFLFSAEPSHLSLGVNFTKGVSVNVTVDKTSREVFLRVQVAASGKFTCDRCIDEFDRQVIAAHQMIFVYGEQDKTRFPQHEVQVLGFGTPFIDISEDVRQFIMLAVPRKLLCKDDCSGLCPRCGTNWNHGTCTCGDDEADPRWMVLKKFKN